MEKKSEIPILSKRNEAIIIIFYWIIFTIIFFVDIKISKENNYPSFLLNSFDLFGITFYIVQILTFFIIYFIILPKLIDIKNWKKSILAILLSFICFILLRYIIEQLITDILFDTINYFEGTPFLFYFYDNIYFGSLIVFSTLFIWTTIHFIKTLQQNNIIEKEKNDAEINFLKSQINPHFLFNTLNNIYSLVSVNSNKSLKAIENLSEIMRFTTYETNKDKIEIEREIDYINQYLDLEQIRYGEKFYVEKEFLIENSKKLIHPYIISPLIENAIKHGVVKDINHPIKINLKTNSEHLEISVSNKINQHQKDETSGIGLTNLKKRLNYYFGNNYSFEIKNDYETFHIYLKIPLNDEN